MKKTARGFTLVELLVVIAIIAILAAVVVLIINPLELMKRSRDAVRFTDLANLQQAINVAVQESTQSTSLLSCNGVSGYCAGWSTSNARATDGTGWVKVNLGASKSVSVPTLPIDPVNSPGVAAAGAGQGLHYYYCGNDSDWELRTVLESAQQAPKMTTDGGTDANTYQVGSKLDMTGGDCTGYNN